MSDDISMLITKLTQIAIERDEFDAEIDAEKKSLEKMREEETSKYQKLGDDVIAEIKMRLHPLTGRNAVQKIFQAQDRVDCSGNMEVHAVV